MRRTQWDPRDWHRPPVALVVHPHGRGRRRGPSSVLRLTVATEQNHRRQAVTEQMTRRRPEPRSRQAFLSGTPAPRIDAAGTKARCRHLSTIARCQPRRPEFVRLASMSRVAGEHVNAFSWWMPAYTTCRDHVADCAASAMATLCRCRNGGSADQGAFAAASSTAEGRFFRSSLAVGMVPFGVQW